MPTFKDKTGREWVLELDVPAIKRLESRVAGFKIDGLLTEAGVFALFEDAPRFVDALWVLVERQAADAGVGQEQFAEALPGHVLDAAGVAFVGALVAFTPSHRRRAVAALVAKIPELVDRATDDAIARINAAALSTPATGAAGSSGSAPAPPG